MSRQSWLERRRSSIAETGEELGPVPEPASVSIPMVCGVVVAGVVLEIFHPTLNPGSLSWIAVVLFAVGLLLVATLTSGMVARLVCGMMRGSLPGSVEPIVQATALGALWVPAWVICLRYPDALMVAAACFCLWSLNRSIKRYEAGGSGPTNVAKDNSGLLRLPVDDSKMLVRVLLPALGVAVLAQSAVTAMVLDKYVIGSLVAGGCVAGLVWMSSGRVLRARVMGESRGRVVGMRVVAFVFTIIVLLPYMRRPATMMGLPLLPGVAAAPRVVAKTPGINSGFTGIILLPLMKPEKRIVAPASKGPAVMGHKIAEPMVIPFDGVYWYFKAPDMRPEPSAHLVKGNSMKAKIRSTDAYPLLMDAHQELGVPIDLSCCSRVEVAVQNADRRPGAIYLELWLRDRSLPGMMGKYVGTMVIPSTLATDVAGRGAATDELLEFSLPADLRRGKFDEITVGVRSDPVRAREGAQIGIRQFVLYP